MKGPEIMRLKVSATIVAAIGTVAILTGCAAGSPGSGGQKFSYSQPAVDPYQSAESKGVMAEYARLGHGTIPATNANGSASQQLADVQTLVNQGASGIVMSVLDAQAIVPAIQYANKKNVPVVAIDEAPKGGKVSMIVRADNVKMGELACEQMGALVKAGQGVVTLDGDPTSSNGRDRTDGFNECMAAKFPGVKLYHVATKWSAATAATGLQTAFNQHDDVAGVYVQSDTTFYPTVLDTLKKLGKTAKVGESGHVALVSVDGGPASLAAIRSGQQDAVVEQPLSDYITFGVPTKCQSSATARRCSGTAKCCGAALPLRSDATIWWRPCSRAPRRAQRASPPAQTTRRPPCSMSPGSPTVPERSATSDSRRVVANSSP
ncbi:sugar ABC transporter substrate-binding protein [Leifsonia poae]|uniref:sugar ABC transporter substrate-binding protein n=1 Tax=Leifsonia poae TaxID=110933 RepID=UPI001CC19F9A|nr:sugar ABC transporter substrate-binding protein [Leifsonia poae]